MIRQWFCRSAVWMTTTKRLVLCSKRVPKRYQASLSISSEPKEWSSSTFAEEIDSGRVRQTDSMTTQILQRLRTISAVEEITFWDDILKHVGKLKAEDKYTEVLEIGLAILSRGKNAIFPIYAAITEALLRNLDSPDAYETVFLIMDQMYALNYFIPSDHLSQLLEAVLKQADPFLRYRYILHLQTLISRRKVAKKFLYRFLFKVIQMYISTGEIEGALNFIGQIAADNPRKNFQLPTLITEALLLAVLRLGDVSLAMEVVNRLEKSGSAIYSRTWGIFVSHAARERHLEAVDYAWKNALIPGRVVVDDATYKMIIETAVDHGHIPLAKWAFMRMRRRKQLLGIKEDNNIIDLFGRIIEAHGNERRDETARSRAIIDAISLISKVRHEVSALKLRHLPNLINSLAQSRDQTEHLDRISRIFKDSEVVREVKTLLLNIGLAATLTSPDRKRGLLFFEYFTSQDDIFPNDDTILCLLLRAHEDRDLLLLRDVLTYKDNFNIPDTRQILETIILTFRDLDMPDEEEQYLTRLKRLGPYIRPYIRDK